MWKINLIQFQVRCLCTEARLLRGTLTQRFHDYLEGKSIEDNVEKQRIIEHVEEIVQTARHSSHRMRLMDKSYMKSLRNQMRTEDTIGCLEFLVKSYPNQIINLRFFREALAIMLNNQAVCKEHFVRLCFLIGSLKKHHPGPDYLNRLLKSCLDEKIDELNRMDFAILCISSYKSSVRIPSKKFHERLIKEVLNTNDDDTYILVSFIKSLKFNQIQSLEVIEKLRDLIEAFEFDYSSLVHILPYIADNSIKDSKMVDLICNRCIKTFDIHTRCKDVQKFLHSCAMLNLKMQKSDLEALESIIASRASSIEFETHFDHFVNAVLSLWMLNYHSKELVDILFKDYRFHKTGPQSRVKLDSRMKLLETCVEIEKPKWIAQKNLPSFMENRPAPGFLIKSSLEKAMNQNLRGKNGEFVQQIKNVNIAGVFVPEESTHYEILDKSTSLSDRKTYNGIFQLKLRLLRKQKCNVKVISIF